MKTLVHPRTSTDIAKAIEKLSSPNADRLIKLIKEKSGRLKEKGIEHEISSEKGVELLCIYDGIKLRSVDQKFTRWLQQDEQRSLFDLKSTADASGKHIIRYTGKYKNLVLSMKLVKRNWILYISGSVHKFFNILTRQESQNYNDFYWKDFLKVYDELIKVFQFDPKDMDVVNLEAGVNCLVPTHLNLTTPEIMENIISLFNVCRSTNWILEPNQDFFKVKRGERYLKFYDKSIQKKLLQQIVRLELGYERSRQIIKDCKAKSFFDLTKPETSVMLEDCLIMAFETIHTYHPALYDVPLHEIGSDREILKYNNPLFWCELKHRSRYQHDKKRQKHDLLISKYCQYSLTTVIIEMLVKKLR